ncbi:hypothetical protein GE21DRAFT_1346919 [Neurospora crassa]|nr:hypothetical protein GE21DRAFT_1346919 [Neurospora crassa]
MGQSKRAGGRRTGLGGRTRYKTYDWPDRWALAGWAVKEQCPWPGAQWTVTGLAGTLALALAATGTFSGSKMSFLVSEPGWQGTVTVVKETVIVWIVVAGRTGTRRSGRLQLKRSNGISFSFKWVAVKMLGEQ